MIFIVNLNCSLRNISIEGVIPRGWVPKDICQGGGTYLATTNPTSSTGGGGSSSVFLVGFVFQILEVVTKYGSMLRLKSSDGGEKTGFVNRRWRKPKIH